MAAASSASILNGGAWLTRTAIPSGCAVEQHVVVTVDGGPKIITFVVDGQLCDGGEYRQFGWGRFNPNYRGPNGGRTLRIGASIRGEIKALTLYNRYLRTSEAVANFRAGSVH